MVAMIATLRNPRAGAFAGNWATTRAMACGSASAAGSASPSIASSAVRGTSCSRSCAGSGPGRGLARRIASSSRWRSCRAISTRACERGQLGIELGLQVAGRLVHFDLPAEDFRRGIGQRAIAAALAQQLAQLFWIAVFPSRAGKQPGRIAQQKERRQRDSPDHQQRAGIAR